MTTIEIARDFSVTPGPRYERLGPNSGEAFRRRLSEELAKSEDDVVVVLLDGTEGYGSSFLEEAFGGLVRDGRFSADEIQRRLQIVAKSRLYVTYAKEATSYLQDAIAHSNPGR